jgi:hypothetical protein
MRSGQLPAKLPQDGGRLQGQAKAEGMVGAAGHPNRGVTALQGGVGPTGEPQRVRRPVLAGHARVLPHDGERDAVRTGS